jgi:hypothetical protein
MKELTLHQRLTAELDAAHAVVRDVITDLSEERAAALGTDGWCAKDHLTHLTLWHEMRFFEISRISRGGQPSFPLATEEQVTPLNDVVANGRRRLPLSQVVADLEFAWRLVADAVSACPADALEHGFSGEIGPIGTGHDLAHVEMIKRILASNQGK